MNRRVAGVVAAAAIGLVPACVTAQRGGTAAGAAAPVTFERHVAPFAVRDTAGRPLPQPFLGGFDVPRPQFVDIDGDGDQDLFVQERPDALMFFERVGEAYVWRTDRWLDLPIGEWYRFADLDGDGRAELLAESPISYVRAWRNVGTPAAPRFAVWADTLRNGDGSPLPADRQNILAVTDLDCNGRPDLFLGRVEGTVDRYEALPAAAGEAPRFALVAERFEEIEILGPVPGMPAPVTRGGSMHGANTLAFGDVDGDGDPDLFWGDYFEQGVLLIENRAARCAAPDFRVVPRRFPDSTSALTSGYNAPAFGDADGDGRPDLVFGVIGGAYSPRTTAVENLWHIAREADGGWRVRARRLVPTLDVGSDAAPSLADLDGDGDLDLLVGNKIAVATDTTAVLAWFENVGTRTAPALRDRGALGVAGDFHFAPATGDLDGDGRPDLLLGTFRDRVQWWRGGVATGFALADSAVVTLTRGSNTMPALADLDGDGDLDLVVGEASGQLNLYRNDGTRTAPRFVLVSDRWLEIDVGRRSAPAFLDVDGDGRLDLLVGSEDGGVQWWRRVGEPAALQFAPMPDRLVRTPPFSAPAVGDLTGDGVPDLLVGIGSGGLFYFAGSRGSSQKGME